MVQKGDHHGPRRNERDAPVAVVRVVPDKMIRLVQDKELSKKKAGLHVLEAYANELGS